MSRHNADRLSLVVPNFGCAGKNSGPASRSRGRQGDRVGNGGSVEPEADLPVNAVAPPVLTPASGRGAWLLRWRAGERKTFYLCALVLGSSAFVLLIYMQTIWAEFIGQIPGQPPPFGDFFALWSYAKIASAQPAAALYDFAGLHASQVALGMVPSAYNPFPYPPTFILYLWPLSLLPYEAAYLVWMLATLALFVWAVVATCSRLPLCVLGVIVAPAGIATIASGQSGFLAAALITAGVRLGGSRPLLAGLLIGLLSYKPQLGLLVPIAFVAAGFWTALGVACTTALALALVATLAFGWAVWPAWISMLSVYAGMFDRETVGLKFMPTVMANLRKAGVTLPVAKGVQAVVALAVAILVWRCFRRHPGRLATAALLVGTFLATPHAFVYDLPMVTAALALFIAARTDAGSTLRLEEVLILILAFLFPVFMLKSGVNLPVSTVPLVLFFGLILWREKNPRRPHPAAQQLGAEGPAR